MAQKYERLLVRGMGSDFAHSFFGGWKNFFGFRKALGGVAIDDRAGRNSAPGLHQNKGARAELRCGRIPFQHAQSYQEITRAETQTFGELPKPGGGHQRK